MNCLWSSVRKGVGRVVSLSGQDIPDHPRGDPLDLERLIEVLEGVRAENAGHSVMLAFANLRRGIEVDALDRGAEDAILAAFTGDAERSVDGGVLARMDGPAVAVIVGIESSEYGRRLAGALHASLFLAAAEQSRTIRGGVGALLLAPDCTHPGALLVSTGLDLAVAASISGEVAVRIMAAGIRPPLGQLEVVQ